MTVALETTLTDALIREGLVRETISKIQTQRRESDFAVSDRIRVTYDGDDALCALLADDDTWQREVLAVSAVRGQTDQMRDWDINGKPLRLCLTRAQD